MSNLASAFQPAIDALEQEFSDLERQANALLTSINVLRARAGLPPKPGGFFDGQGTGAEQKRTSPGSVAIRSDAFVGKRMRAAVREYLQMRKDANIDAPATTREILDALKDGGFESGAKDDATAMVVLRTMLRKGSDMFRRLDNGRWGLQAWYGTVRRRHRAAVDQNPSHVEESDLDTDVMESETAEADEASAA